MIREAIIEAIITVSVWTGFGLVVFSLILFLIWGENA